MSRQRGQAQLVRRLASLRIASHCKRLEASNAPADAIADEESDGGPNFVSHCEPDFCADAVTDAFVRREDDG